MLSPVIVGVAVVEQDQHFLVGQRAAGDVLAGLAEFPGGKCEIGETTESAAIRECLEETGVPVVVSRTILRQTHTYPHGVVELHFFLCHPLDATAPKPPFVWLTLAEVLARKFPEANAPVLKWLRESVAGREGWDYECMGID